MMGRIRATSDFVVLSMLVVNSRGWAFGRTCLHRIFLLLRQSEHVAALLTAATSARLLGSNQRCVRWPATKAAFARLPTSSAVMLKKPSRTLPDLLSFD